MIDWKITIFSFSLSECLLGSVSITVFYQLHLPLSMLLKNKLLITGLINLKETVPGLTH